jgi:putative tricarboxylic transport membrane protein
MLIHGIRPGPLLLQDHPDIFWGVVSSMYIGNVMLLILNLPLIALWVQVLKVPYRILFPLILLFCLIGSYSLKNSVFDVLVMIISGIIGYLFRKFGYEGAPLILAFVLGPMLELNLRQSLFLSKGSLLIFFTRPIFRSYPDSLNPSSVHLDYPLFQESKIWGMRQLRRRPAL